MKTLPLKIGFIGAGKMAQALAGRFVASGVIDRANVYFFCPSESTRAKFVQLAPGATCAESNEQIVEQCDLAFLAVKPQVFSQNEFAASLGKTASTETTFVSIMAGVTLDEMAFRLKTKRLIRTMPNTPCQIGCGITAISVDESVDSEVESAVLQMFETTGSTVSVPENAMNLVTGVSGSGPAYVFTFVEALVDAGVKIGLSREVASKLAVETVMGAASMVRQTGQHPATLRDAVTSPGGTTICGLAALEENQFRHAIISAVEASARRAQELSG